MVTISASPVILRHHAEDAPPHGLALLSVLKATPFGDAPLISAGAGSRRSARLRLAPPISTGRPSVLLSRCYVTASALARPLWRLRRYQSSPLLERLQRAGRINARRASDEFNHLLKLGGAELGDDLVNASLVHQQNSRDDGLRKRPRRQPSAHHPDEEGYQNNSSSRRNIFR